MSNPILNSAWKVSGITGTEKLVLVRLADRADKNGLCYPGQTGLAEDCCLTTRAVRNAINSLTAAGHLEVVEQATFTTPKTYRVTPMTPEQHSGGEQDSGEESGSADSGTVFRSPPERRSDPLYGTPIEPSITHGTLPSAEDDPFEALAILEGWTPTTPLTKSAGGKVGQSLKDIQTVQPGVTGTQIRERIAAYKREFPRAVVTASAIAKHWQRLKPKAAPQPLQDGFIQ